VLTSRLPSLTSVRSSLRQSISKIGSTIARTGSSGSGGGGDDGSERTKRTNSSSSKKTSNKKNKNKKNGNNNDDNLLPKVLVKKDRQPMFRVVDGLGMGGFSIVLKVQDIKTYKTWAMKKISKSKSSMTWQSRLQQKLEIDIMKELPPSPFVQKCEYIFEDSKHIYMVFEELKGDLFYHFSSRMGALNNFHAFSENECKTLLAELYLAVEHIHNHGVVHRDIKLENIMMTKQGHLKLVDFGLAMRIEADTQPMFPSGSISLMPPELIRNHTGGRHTDWWAYGVLAHELLTGHTPWSSLTDNRVISNEILNNRVQPPFETEVSQWASDFICDLLNPDFRERLGTIPSSAPDKLNHKNNIRNCRFFNTISWELYAYSKNIPAFIPGEDYMYESDRLKIFEEHKASHCSMIVEDTNSREEEDFDEDELVGKLDGGGGGDNDNDNVSISNLSTSSSIKDIKNGWNLGYPRASDFLLI
jgi:serine/threonine protein kinase